MTWPTAFTVVGCAFAVALFFGTLVTERWPWERR